MLDNYIHTYILQLTNNRVLVENINYQFNGRQEFLTEIINCSVSEPSSPYDKLKGIVKNAISTELDFVLICEETHAFTKDYSKEFLFYSIYTAGKRNCDVLLGCVDKFGYPLPITSNLFLLDLFFGTQFMIIFRSYYHRFLEQLENSVTLNSNIQSLKSSNMVISPFISTKVNLMVTNTDQITQARECYYYKMSNKVLSNIRQIYSAYTIGSRNI